MQPAWSNVNKLITIPLPAEPVQETISLQTPCTEAEQVCILRLGTQKSISQLHQNYAPSLLGIIIKIVKAREIAEDILQETFVKIWHSSSQYDESKGRLFTWMARLAKNTAIDHLRSRSGINAAKNCDLDRLYTEIDKANQTSYNPETIGIRQLTTTLSTSQQSVLELIYFQGYTQSEVAKKLDMPIGTVKTKIRTAILRLRKHF